VQVTTGPGVNCGGVEPAREPFGGCCRARVAPTQDPSQRPALPVQGKETVAEARAADRLEVLVTRRFVDGRANELDYALRIVLPCVVATHCLGFRKIGFKDLRANRRGTDVDREDPRHAGTIASGCD
jgi:hypothetical protein